MAQESPRADVQRSGQKRRAHGARASSIQLLCSRPTPTETEASCQRGKNSPQALWCEPTSQPREGPGAGMYLMMVCMPRTCGVLSRTLSVFGSGCPWWAEARAALQGGRGSELGSTCRAAALGPWRDSTPPKKGSRTPQEDQHHAWPSHLDPKECPKSGTRHEIPEPDYPKRLGQTSWTTHAAAAASAGPAALQGRTFPCTLGPGCALCEVQGLSCSNGT